MHANLVYLLLYKIVIASRRVAYSFSFKILCKKNCKLEVLGLIVHSYVLNLFRYESYC
jgi:hypothetical protein